MLVLNHYPTEIRRFLARLSDWVAEIIREDAAAGATIAFLQMENIRAIFESVQRNQKRIASNTPLTHNMQYEFD